MKISGFQKLTLLDYPGHLACLIFTTGCNFRCPYCYNSEMVDPKKIKAYHDFVPENEIFEHLAKRKKLLDGVVLSGGEPTLQADLEDFIRRIKEMGFLVKLDTNGARPEVLKKLYQKKMLDFVAMDLKSSLSKYPKVTRVKVDPQKIQKSIELIMNSKIPYEFRTTVLPCFHNKTEIEKMAKVIKGAENYFLQQFLPKKTLDPRFMKEKKYSGKELQALAEIAGKYVKKAGVRS